MDKIYSRKRIKIFYSDSKKIKKKMAVLLLLITIVSSIVLSVNSLNPIFDELCKEKAMSIATQIINTETTKAVHEYDYKDIVSITKTEKNNILKTDVSIINDIASDIATKVTEKLKKQEHEQIKIPVGALFGNKYLSGTGPDIKITIIPSGTVETDIKTEFASCGINQSVYRIYLEVRCNLNILTSYKNIETNIVNQVLLVETVVVGDVPETYYDLDGLDKENSIDIIE